VSSQPSSVPSSAPSQIPSREPSSAPSSHPSSEPSSAPSSEPSSTPSTHPSSLPSSLPSHLPSGEPSAAPSSEPSSAPSDAPSVSSQPSTLPSSVPSLSPSSEPSSAPSNRPSQEPSSAPSYEPSSNPSAYPSSLPSYSPSELPSSEPSAAPSTQPSSAPSDAPSYFPYPFAINGSSTIVEDVPKNIGDDFDWQKIRTALVENIQGIFISNFPIGSVISYEFNGVLNSTSVSDPNFVLKFEGNEASIVARLSNLTLTAPLHSDQDFALNVTIRADTDNFNQEAYYVHQVKVQAVADSPNVAAENLQLNEDSSIPLEISASSSADRDNSEVLSLVFRVTSDTSGVLGTLTSRNSTNSSDPSVIATFNHVGNGVYTLNVTGPDADSRDTYLTQYLESRIIEFTPRDHWSGEIVNAIMIEAVSTETATGYGDQLAPNDSPTDGTGGDVDTKVEIAVTYINITVFPVNEVINIIATSQIVPENGGSQNNSQPTLVDFGRVISTSFSIPDKDGSQSVSLTFEGFPMNASISSSLSTLPDGADLTVFPNNTVILYGSNVSNVEYVLSTLEAIVTDDDDHNFDITVTIKMTDNGANVQVVDTTVFTHSVVIQAVADMPTIDVPSSITPINENTDFVVYPVIVALNDRDGSETYLKIVVNYSTPGNGNPPEFQFQNFPNVSFDYNTPGTITITGNGDDLEEAMKTMAIKPGEDNGEDINIEISATAIESNPSESGANEVLKLTATTLKQFEIEVTPTTPGNITISFNATRVGGLEDSTITLGPISIEAPTDADGSLDYFLEFKVDELPPGLKINVDGVEYNLTSGTIVDGYIRLPAQLSPVVELVPPLHWSGSFNVAVRGSYTDTASDGDTSTAVSVSSTIPVDVFPVGDCFELIDSMEVTEDIGPVTIGSVLASQIALEDDGNTTENNNVDSETIIQIELIGLELEGVYAPASNEGESNDGFGNTVVTYRNVSGTPVYTITSKIPASNSSTTAELLSIETDIRTTLGSLTYSLIGQSDEEQVLTVQVTTLDVNLGVAANSTCSEPFTIKIVADADVPTVSTTNPVGVYMEDGENIPLNISIGPSADSTDGSENLKVTVTVPQRASDDLLDGPMGILVATILVSGVTMEEVSQGVYEIAASDTSDGEENDTSVVQASKINSFLAGLQLDPAEHWAGTSSIAVDVTSTEEANGDSETVSSTIVFTVRPVANDLDDSRFKANSYGYEDTLISIPLELQVLDSDGSESFLVHIDPASFPNGTTFYGVGGNLIQANSTGWVTVTQDDALSLKMLPPLHWSTAGSGEIILLGTAEVVDRTDDFVSSKIFKVYPIDVYVKGVAKNQDEPDQQTIVVLALEDNAYDIGSNINIEDALVDKDGSEKLSLVLSGLPRGVIPYTGIDSDGNGISDGISLRPDGSWQVAEEAIPHLKLPPVLNYSGEKPYPNLKLQALTQEVDGDQSLAVTWDIFIEVEPVADGIRGFNTSITTREGTLEETDGKLSLATIGQHGLADNDSSEIVLNYTIDFSTMIDDARIRQRLLDLNSSLAPESLDANYLIENYLEGIYTANGNGTVTVARANIAGLYFRGLIFWDLSGKWTLRLSALVEDSATIDGVLVKDTVTEYGKVDINVLGTADTPTAFANDTSGTAGDLILVHIGGESTDTDVQLGRNQSERIYYIMSLETDLSLVNISGFVFADAQGQVVGQEGGVGTWFFSYEDLQSAVYFKSDNFANGTLNFLFTTVAEEDETSATTSVPLSIEVNYNPNPGVFDPPCQPSLDLDDINGTEDEAITIDWYDELVENCEDGFNDTISVIFRDFPKGWTLSGSYYNFQTGRWVTVGDVAYYDYISDKGDFIVSLDAIKNGRVSIGPPTHFSGTQMFHGKLEIMRCYMKDVMFGSCLTIFYIPVIRCITVEAIAKNEYLLSSSSGVSNVAMYWEPVADGVSISAQALGSLYEDQSFRVNITYYAIDWDGSEEIGEWVFMQFDDARVNLLGYDKVEGPFTFQGQTLSWYYIINYADLGTLEIQPPEHWHGTISGSLFMNATEFLAPYPTKMSNVRFSFKVAAVADVPLLTVPTSSVMVLENEQVALPNLFAALVDNVTENGAEYLAVVFEGVPEDSFFLDSAGNRVGEPSIGGIWTIFDPADLVGIEYKPPPYWSGRLTLRLTATVVELSNGDQRIESSPFDIVIEPVASEFEILTNDVNLPASGLVDFRLILLDDRGTDPGENPPEVIELTFSDVPQSTFLRASMGGRLENNGPGTWIFTGTQDQANAIQMINSAATAKTSFISVSGKTLDAGDELDTALTDDFPFRVFISNLTTVGVEATATNSSLVGSNGNDILYGTAIPDQTIMGQSGMDLIYNAPERQIMSGGAGADQFVWTSMADLAGDLDEITDFDVAEGDQLILGGLLNNSFDLQLGEISNVVRLVDYTTYSVVEIFDGTVWLAVVQLDSITGITAQSLWDSGNLLM
jgi:hypothetical protein